MQADRFTVKSQEAVAAAQRQAAESRNPEVAPPHLLLAVLEQDDGLAPAVLRKLGADLPAISERARRLLADLPAISGETEPEVRPAQAFVRVLQRAEKEMAALGDEPRASRPNEPRCGGPRAGAPGTPSCPGRHLSGAS